MSYLLDTHILLYWLSDRKKLSLGETTILKNPNNVVFVSSVVIWEISIKKSLNKLDIPDNYYEEFEKSAFIPLPINHRHALKVAELPYYHHDPFDRLLIAQAKSEKIIILTHDKIFKKYDVKLLQSK